MQNNIGIEALRFLSVTYYIAILGCTASMLMQPEWYFKFGGVAIFTRALFQIITVYVDRNERAN